MEALKLAAIYVSMFTVGYGLLGLLIIYMFKEPIMEVLKIMVAFAAISVIGGGSLGLLIIYIFGGFG